MSKNIYIVYKITNKVNNKFYIGITSKSLSIRFNQHLNRKTNYIINQAVKKYGKENFIVEQIDKAETYNQLLQKEIYYIDKLKPDYNMTKGGQGIVGFKHSLQTKKKISLALTGDNNPMKNPEVKQKIILALTGIKRSDEFKKRISLARKGWKYSDETKEKLRLSNLGKKRSQETCRRIGLSKRGFKHTEETKMKLRLAALAWRAKLKQ
jgi:group I intron endonuclease